MDVRNSGEYRHQTWMYEILESPDTAEQGLHTKFRTPNRGVRNSGEFRHQTGMYEIPEKSDTEQECTKFRRVQTPNRDCVRNSGEFRHQTGMYENAEEFIGERVGPVTD
ncbi:hypothetical protein BaRGS_00010132 [Batillaria attramentaria]|uniref:Uncharacterized protein n=1 Tax=Batillaria attramentaria TaxID=370345 RepID=A0ABD0LGJ9_9CAEN